MKKILVIGMYEEAMYHPLTGVDVYLKEKHPAYEYHFTNKIEALETVSSYDGVISYWDDWNHAIPDTAAHVLYDYVEKGGRFLILHNGISFQLQPSLEQMMGGKFLSHPQQEAITFVMKEHFLTEGCGAFTLVEEPYQFALLEDEKEMFLSYEYRGNVYPAGWRKTFGLGELIYLTPGHTPEKFEDASYTRLIANCMKYLFD